jgi:hypothetical protein
MGYFDSRAGMDAVGKTEIPYPYIESNPDSSDVQLAVYEQY